MACLFDFDCCAEGRNETRGLAVLDTDKLSWEADDLELLEIRFEEQAIRVLWKVDKSELHRQSYWNLDRDLGLRSRRDRLIDRSHEPVVVKRCTHVGRDDLSGELFRPFYFNHF